MTCSIVARRLAGGLLPALLALACTAGPARARAEFQQMETSDMRLFYIGPTQGFLAPYTAQCFERSMRFYREQFDFTPSERVNVILTDASDFMNASVGVTPRDRMLVYFAPANFVYETNPANERINFLMNHEMAHVVTLDRPAGSDKLFRALFHGKVDATDDHPETMVYGYLTNPRRAASRWYWEGLAVFMETWMSGGLGRAQGPWDEMVFRAMVQDSARFWDPLGLESEGVKTDFQASVNSYLYGTRFICWLAWTYGPGPVKQWLARQPGSRAYFASDFERLFHKSLNDAWSDWIAWEHDFQKKNLEAIHRYPVTTGRDLSKRALGSVSRAYVDSASHSLIAAVLYPGVVAHIASISLDDGSTRRLREVKGPALYFVSSLAYDPAARRIFYTTDNDSWRDIASYDLATGRAKTLIRDARVGDLVFNRADRSLLGVRHFNGISSVVRIDEPWTNWTLLAAFPYGTDVYDLDVSPDGHTLSASVAEISGRQSLRLYDLTTLAKGDTASRTLYDFGSSIPQAFQFSPDGRYLFGSSYYTGVSNIFRFDLQADSMDVVTNASTGYFRPIPLGGDSLIAFRYTGEGFVPSLLHAHPLTDVSAITFFGAQIVRKYPELRGWRVPPPSVVKLDSVVVAKGPYHPLASVRPTTVYPIVEAYKNRTGPGLQLNISDPIFRHSADVTVSVTPDDNLPADERVHVTGSYRYYEWTLKGRYNPASFYDLFGPTKTSRKGVNGSLRYDRTLIRDAPRTLDLSTGIDGWTGLERLPDYQNVATSPGFDKLLSWDASLAFKNLRSSIGAADWEKGVKAGLEGGVNGVRFVRAGHAAWRGYPWAAATFDAGVPTPVRNTSIWLRTAAGGSPGDPAEPFANFYFGGFGNNWIDHQDPKRYRQYTSFPGVGLNDVGGTTFGRAMLDLNLPALRFSRLGAMRLYASWARLSVFGGALVANPDRVELRRTLGNVGAQADIRLQFLIHQPLTLSFGWAHAFERHLTHDDEWMASLKIL